MKQLKLAIDVGADGTATAMHMDEFSLGFLGKQAVTRASDIRFDSTDQKWYIWPAGNEGQFEICCTKYPFTEYGNAREFEVAWFNACRIRGCTPLSEKGCTVADFLYLNRS